MIVQVCTCNIEVLPLFFCCSRLQYASSVELFLMCLRLNKFPGKWLGSRQIRCNWAAKGAGLGDEQQNPESKNVVELTNGTSG